MTNYEPSPVALVRVGSDYPAEIGVHGGNQWFVAGPRLGSQHGWHEDHIEIVRPLVVLDEPNPRRLYAALMAAVEATGGYSDTAIRLRELATQIRKQTEPPKPPEPTGFGARVALDPGIYEWAQAVHLGGGRWEFADSSGNGGRTTYEHLVVTEVLSEGVS